MHRVPECLSPRRNWVPPPPSPTGEYAGVHGCPKTQVGETHSPAREGVEVPSSNGMTKTLLLYAYYNPSTILSN